MPDNQSEPPLACEPKSPADSKRLPYSSLTAATVCSIVASMFIIFDPRALRADQLVDLLPIPLSNL
jgi:hypothetical protein